MNLYNKIYKCVVHTVFYKIDKVYNTKIYNKNNNINICQSQ